VPEFLVFEWLELVEDRQQDHGRQLGQKNGNGDKSRPPEQPPVVGKLPDDPVEQLDQKRGDNDAHEKTLDLVPDPGARLLVREAVTVFQPEAVVVESQAEHFADQGQYEDIEDDRQHITLKGAPVGEIANRAAPARNDENEEET